MFLLVELVIWRFGDLMTWRIDDLEIWRFDDLVIWRFGDFVIWRLVSKNYQINFILYPIFSRLSRDE
jgi:hypothetical protein